MTDNEMTADELEQLIAELEAALHMPRWPSIEAFEAANFPKRAEEAS